MKKSFIIFFTLLPFVSMAQDPTHYESAYQEITAMLNGEQEPDFKRAVFISENAYFNNALSFSDFNDRISHYKKLAEKIAQSDGILDYEGTDKETVKKYWSAYLSLKDTVLFEVGEGDDKEFFTSHPLTYDFNDFYGEKDWSKMFVTKLLATHKGNCHSMPYLYKILVEEMGGKAHLSMAPNHIYIKQWADQTGWFNTEMTSGQFPLDSWIMASGYIKLEAIQNKVFMAALNEKESLSLILVDLAQGYQRKLGELADNTFILKCLYTALENYPQYAHARILRAETYKTQYQTLMNEYGIEDHSELQRLPDAKKVYTQMQKEFKAVYDLGYRKMPKEMYLNWLMDIDEKNNTKKSKRFEFEAPQPFEKYGYKVPVATLSKGRFEEFFDQDSIVQVGTVMMNRFSGQVTHFVEYDTVYSEATLEPEVISRWLAPDPLAELYYDHSPYNFVLNNPIRYIDPDGRKVKGLTEDDAEKLHEDLNKVFAGEQFEGLRALFTRGKKNNKNKFDKIDSDALASALEGLEGDDLALAQLVTGAINSKDLHTVEFAELKDELSVTATNAINETTAKLFTDNGLTPPPGKTTRTGSEVAASGGSGQNFPTTTGSHSVILHGDGVTHSGERRELDTFHEIFGHGIPSARKTTHAINNAHAIRTENLVRRVLNVNGQRDGSAHAGGKITNPSALPKLKKN